MRISTIWLTALLLAVFVAGCGGGGVDGGGPTAPALDTTPPILNSTNPADTTTGVAINGKLVANFSEAIDPATCTAATFTLVPSVAGSTVSCVGSHAIFAPTGNLAASTAYTATVTTGIKDLAGNALALAANNTWGFTTGTTLDTTAPTMVSTDPIDTSTGVPVNKEPAATFSEAIDPATVTSFTLTSQGTGLGCVHVFPDPDPCPPPAPGSSIAGTASTTGTGNVVTFVPLITLRRSTTGAAGITRTYTATITGVKDLAGNALASPLTWTFTTGAGASAGPYAGAGPAPLALGQAAAFAVLAETGITNAPASVITGNVGANTPSSSITGFSPLTLDPDTGVFSTSTQVTGKIFALDYHVATADELDNIPDLVGRDLATDVSDMGLAYTDAAGRKLPAPVVDLSGGNISGSLVPGLYKFTTGVNIGAGGLTLSATSVAPNDAKDAWIFQIAGNLTVANNAVITLSNGALAKNVFWQVGGQATLGTASNFKGTILSNTQIVLQTNAVLTGRALAKTQVTLDHNTVTTP